MTREMTVMERAAATDPAVSPGKLLCRVSRSGLSVMLFMQSLFLSLK